MKRTFTGQAARSISERGIMMERTHIAPCTILKTLFFLKGSFSLIEMRRWFLKKKYKVMKAAVTDIPTRKMRFSGKNTTVSDIVGMNP